MGYAQYRPPTREQRIRACRAILSFIGYERLWTSHGPTPEAVHLLQQYGGAMSNDEWVLFQVAWVVWGRETGVRLSEILRLEGQRLQFVTKLLEALATGSEAVEVWLKRGWTRPQTPGRVTRPAAFN